MGTGRAMDDPRPEDASERRKRSIDIEQSKLTNDNVMEDYAENSVVRRKRSFHPKFGPIEMQNSLTDTVVRSKRQTGGQQIPNGGQPGMPGGNDIFDKMKQMFNRVVDTCKQWIGEATKMLSGAGQQKPPGGNKVETFQ